jgi:GT2 family glycosyltransferase
MTVMLAISSFNGDRAAFDLAALALSTSFEDLVAHVAVIDSGDDEHCQALADALRSRLPQVTYIHREGNLGSAGNLVARLQWARREGADVLLAVNADGVLIAGNVRRMLACLERTGAAAVYPTHVIGDQQVDLSGLRPVPILPSRRPLARLPATRALKVRWGSSNGAMYRPEALAAADLGSIRSLWYGWEDLALGLALDAAGYDQFMCVEAAQPTASDQRYLPRTHLVVSDKAPWTTYYTVRNLALIGRGHPRRVPRVVLRVAREFVTILLRDRRRERYAKALHGLADGLRGRDGQQVAPTA